jgi:hypothetical protein
MAMALTVREVGGLHAIWLDESLLPGTVLPGWYVPLLSVAGVAGTSKENLTGLLKRKPSLHTGTGNAVLRLERADLSVSRWERLVAAYDSVRVKQTKRKAKKKRKRGVQNLSFYPLSLAGRVMRYYINRGSQSCSAEQLSAVRALLETGGASAGAHQQNYGDDGDGDSDDDDDDDIWPRRAVLCRTGDSKSDEQEVPIL